MVFQEPEARLLENWQKTAKTRLTFIHATSSGDQKVSFTEILSKWPRYKDKNGHTLVLFELQ